TGSELYPHAHAIGTAVSVVIARTGARDATAGERGALVEQVVDRPEHLEPPHVGNLQVVGTIEGEVEIWIHPVVVDAANQVLTPLVLGVVAAVTSVAPAIVETCSSDVTRRQAGGQVAHHVGGGDVAGPLWRGRHTGHEHPAANLAHQVDAGVAVVD